MNLKTTMRVVCILILLSPAVALASMPQAWVQVGDGPRQYLDGWFEDNGVWNLNFTVETADYQVSGNTSMLADPYIAYGVSFTNLMPVTPLLFQFGVSGAITPVPNPATVYGSYSGSGTDVDGNGFSIQPYYSDMDGDGIPEIQISDLNGTDMGVDVGQGYADGPGVPGHSNALGVYDSGPMNGPAGGPWTSLGLALGFTLSGNDVATLNGFTSVMPQPVPEPTSVLLLGGGLIGAALVGTIRRKRA